MPAGYSYKALVGVVRNDGSSNFVAFYQQDRAIWLAEINIFTGKSPVVANTYEVYQAGGGGADVDLRTVVPPNARKLFGTAGHSFQGDREGIAVAADINGIAQFTVIGSRAGATFDGFTLGGHFELPLRTPQTFYWKALDNVARYRLSVRGFEI